MMHGREKSDLAIGAAKPANNDGRPSAELVERRAGAEGNAGQDRTRRAQDRASVSKGLDRIRHVARQRKKERFTALLHHVTPDRLRTAFFALKRQAAPGVDGLTWQAYEADLDRRIESLHERVHRGAYRALSARRGFIPKADGSQRPLAIAALEDKIVQRATAAVLNAIYAEDFLGFWYGFRPGGGGVDGLDVLAVGITRTKVSHILDADIRSFFDAVSQEWLLRFLTHRIGDPRILRLIRKWLRGGVLEDGVVSVGETGTGQGSVISPLLANVYLHYVFDLWAERWRRREARGDMMIVRYADDIVVGFEHEADARRFRDAMRALGGVCADVAPGQDPPDRVWPLRGGPARSARARPTGDVLLPGVHPHLRAIPPGHLPAPAEEPHRPHAGDAAEGQGRAAAAHASADPRPGALVDAGGPRLLCLSCGANEPPCPHGLPPPCDRPVAAHAAAAQPKRPVHMGADGEGGRCLAPPTAPPSPLAE